MMTGIEGEESDSATIDMWHKHGINNVKLLHFTYRAHLGVLYSAALSLRAHQMWNNARSDEIIGVTANSRNCGGECLYHAAKISSPSGGIISVKIKAARS